MIEELKKVIWHINWGDNDNSFVVAETRKEALNDIEMVNWAIPLPALTRLVLKEYLPIIRAEILAIDNPYWDGDENIEPEYSAFGGCLDTILKLFE